MNDLNVLVYEHARAHESEIVEHFAESSDAIAEFRRFRLQSRGELLPIPPAVVPRTMVRRVAEQHRALRRALELVFDVRLRGSWDLLAEGLRLRPATARYVAGARRPRWLTIARPDIVLSGDDISIVEPNAGSSCGMLADADLLGRVFERSPVIGEFLRSMGARRMAAMPALVRLLRRRLTECGFPADALVVVTDYAADLADYDAAFDVLADELCRYGMRAVVAPIEDLDIHRDRVTLHGERCGLVYRFAAEEPDPVGNYPVLAPLLAAARSGALVVFDELEDAIAANKTILALVSEELDAGRLPSPIARRLKDFVPWTRVLEDVPTPAEGRTVPLPDWSAANRERLVLKPGAGFCGRGVLVGTEVDQRTWCAAIESALAADEAWLVQRLVVSTPAQSSVVREGALFAERTFVDYGYFCVGGSVPAGIIRKSAPAGKPTRRVKLAPTGPAFVV